MPSMRAKNLELIRFFTTTTVSLGLEGGGRRHETNQNLFTLPWVMGWWFAREDGHEGRCG